MTTPERIVDGGEGTAWRRHQLDEDGDHDPEGCYACQLEKEVACECRCVECCKALLVEALPEDAEREPLIREKGSPVYADARLTESGRPELEGYLLSGENGCVFLNAETKLCAIYPTRPLACRAFDCDGEGKERLVQLGVRPGGGRPDAGGRNGGFHR